LVAPHALGQSAPAPPDGTAELSCDATLKKLWRQRFLRSSNDSYVLI
jgi:hypothetical protein